MKAHIVGGGFAGLAAAALLIRNAEAPGQDITIYEADDKLGGGYFLEGDAKCGYNLPGSVFDKEFRCAFDLLATIPDRSATPTFPSTSNSSPSTTSTHSSIRPILSIAPSVPCTGPRYGLSLSDGFALAKLSLTPESKLDGRRIEEFFAKHVLRDGILAALVDDHGVAAAAQPDRVPPLHKPLRLPVPRPVDDGACPALAIQSARSVRQTPGRLAHRQRA